MCVSVCISSCLLDTLNTASIMLYISTGLFKPHLSYSDRFPVVLGGKKLLNVTVQMSKGSESAKELGEAED